MLLPKVNISYAAAFAVVAESLFKIIVPLVRTLVLGLYVKVKVFFVLSVTELLLAEAEKSIS